MKRKPYGYWTHVTVKEEALKFTTRTEFINNSKVAYNLAHKKGWLDEICSHMDNSRYRRWSKIKIREVALRYTYLKDFHLKEASAYYTVRKNGWFEECCGHLKKMPGHSTRCIYACEFPDHSVYVGLTWNLKQRENRRSDKEPVELHKKLIGAHYILKQITEMLPMEEAVKQEPLIIQQYVDNGWNLLNRSMRAGQIGGSIRWSFKSLEKEAKKYTTRVQFQSNHVGAYIAARRQGILNQICAHMIPLKTHWTNEQLEKEALKYETRNQFRNGNNSAYSVSHKRGLMKDICEHMGPPKNLKTINYE